MTGESEMTTDVGVDRTSMIRSALTADRGMSAAIHVVIMTDMRICVRYVRNAMSAPGRMRPSLIRSEPNQTTATLEKLTISVAVGNINACRRPPRSAVSVSAVFASANRLASSGSRAKARTTRIPVSCSRIISLMRSMRSCIRRNVGTMLEIMTASRTVKIGIDTMRIRDRPRS